MHAWFYGLAPVYVLQASLPRLICHKPIVKCRRLAVSDDYLYCLAVDCQLVKYMYNAGLCLYSDRL